MYEFIAQNFLSNLRSILLKGTIANNSITERLKIKIRYFHIAKNLYLKGYLHPKIFKDIKYINCVNVMKEKTFFIIYYKHTITSDRKALKYYV